MPGRERGQAIVQSVLVLWLLTGILVGAVVVVASAGTAIYYSVKLSHVARAGARFAVHSRYWLGAQRPFYDASTTEADTIDIVKTMLTQMNLGDNPVSISVDQSDSDNCKVSVKVDQLPLWSAGFLPGFISVSVDGSQPWMNERPVGVFGLSFVVGGSKDSGGLYLPSYGAGGGNSGPSSFPFGGFPYWESGTAVNPPGMAGPLQNNATGGKYQSY